MPRQHAVLAAGPVLALAIVSAVAFALSAQDERAPELLLPADTDIYFGWDGTEKHKPAWERSACYEVLETTRVLRTILDFSLSDKRPDARLPADAIKQLCEGIARKGLSMSIAFPNGDPVPRVVIVLHNAAALERAFTSALPQIQLRIFKFEPLTVRGRQMHRLTFNSYRYTGAAVVVSPGPELSWWSEGGHLVLAFGKGAVDTVLDVAEGKSPGISQSENWRKYREQPKDFPTVLAAWFDVRALRNRLANYTVQEKSGPDRGITLGELIELLGGERTGCFSVRCGFKDRALVSDIKLECPAPRTGLMALADQAPITLADVPPLPAGSAGFIVTSFNWSKAYDVILGVVRRLADAATDNGSAKVDEVMRQAPEVLGFNPKSDLCDSLGHVVCLHIDSAAGVPGGIGLGCAISVQNPERLRKALRAGLQRLQEASSNAFTSTEEERAGRTAWLFDLLNAPIQPAAALDKKWLFVGLTPQEVQSFVMRLDGKLERWKPSAAEEEALKSVPKEFMTLTLLDPRFFYGRAVTYFPIFATRETRATGGPEARRAAARRMAVLADLPPAEVLTRPMFPDVTAVTVDKDGVRFQSRDSVPGLTLIGSLAGPAAGMIWVSER
jgi:hypothetical protein